MVPTAVLTDLAGRRRIALCAHTSGEPLDLFHSPPIGPDPMTLEKITSLQDPASQTPSSGRRRIPAAFLPLGLLLAFLALFGLMFGSRLLPATEVRTAPVLVLRTGLQDGEGIPAETSPPTPAERGSLLFQASGWIEPDPYVIHVSALVSGVVKEVLVLEGQPVRKNDIIATLIEDDARLDVEEATRAVAALDASQVAHCAQLPVLNAEMHAMQQRITAEKAILAELQDASSRMSSVRPGSVSAQEVHRAQLKVEAQEALIEEANAQWAAVLAKINKVELERLATDARIRKAQTELARKKLALERTVIRAPADGIILHRHASPGKKRRLQGDDPKSAVIVELYNPEKLQARIDVPLSEAASLKLGQPVALATDLLPDMSFEGEVTRIMGEADIQRNTLQAKVRLLKPDVRLRPEMLVRAEFYPTSEPGSRTGSPTTGNSRRLTLFAPAEALLDRTRDSARVWVVENDRALLRILQLGSEEREQHVQVLDGLQPGDRVILPPFDELKNGQRVAAAD